MSLQSIDTEKRPFPLSSWYSRF